LYTWLDEVARTGRKLFEAVGGILENRDDVEVEELPPALLYQLSAACRKLERAGYTVEVARNGARKTTHDDAEQKQLGEINAALNDLAAVLAPLLQGAMDRAVRHEMERVFEAMRQLVDAYRRHVTAEAQRLAPALGLTAPGSGLEQVDRSLALSYRFEAGFAITAEYREDDTGGAETYQDGTERRFYTAWLYRHPVYKSRPVYEKRRYDSADIPKVEALLQNWINQAKLQEPDLVRQMIEWMVRQLEHASATLQKSQQELLDRYQAKLDEAHHRAEKLHIQQTQDWSSVLEQARELHRCLEQLCTPPERNGR
jgi:hypothetical protein